MQVRKAKAITGALSLFVRLFIKNAKKPKYDQNNKKKKKSHENCCCS